MSAIKVLYGGLRSAVENPEYNYLYSFLVTFYMLNFLDVVSTAYVLTLGGAKFQEGSPFFQAFHSWGVVGLIKIATIAIITYFVYVLRHSDKDGVEKFLYFLVLGYSAVIVNNLLNLWHIVR